MIIIFTFELWSFSSDNNIQIYCCGSSNPYFVGFIEGLRTGYYDQYKTKKFNIVKFLEESKKYEYDNQLDSVSKIMPIGALYGVRDIFDFVMKERKLDIPETT